jgi:hypothetical protein
MKVNSLIHNQPFMLKPTPAENQINEEGEEGKLREQQKK